MRKTIIAVFLILVMASLIACSNQEQPSSGTSAGAAASPSANTIASNSLNSTLGDVGTSDQDLNVNDTGSATDSGLDDVQTI